MRLQRDRQRPVVGGRRRRRRGRLPGRNRARGPRHRHGHVDAPARRLTVTGGVPGARHRRGQTGAMTDWTGRHPTQRPVGADHRRLDLLGPGCGRPLPRPRACPRDSPARSATSPPGAPRWRPCGPGRGDRRLRLHQPARASPPSSTSSTPTGSRRMWAARDAAVVEGLAAHAPDILEPLADLGPDLWAVVDAPAAGRAGLLRRPPGRWPARPIPSCPGWHAVNCLRRVAGRHPLGARGGRRADPCRGVHPAQRLARLRGGLAGPVPGHHARGPRGRLGRRSRRKGLAADRTVTSERRSPCASRSRTRPTG